MELHLIFLALVFRFVETLLFLPLFRIGMYIKTIRFMISLFLFLFR